MLAILIAGQSLSVSKNTLDRAAQRLSKGRTQPSEALVEKLSLRAEMGLALG